MENSKIVVVDDEEDILEFLKFNFEKERAIVKTFTSGTEALSYIKEGAPDIIVSDWMMEDMEGLELCRKIKTDPLLLEVPFVMLTAKCHETDVVTALEMGAEDYIIKPIRIKELIARLRKITHRNKPGKMEKELRYTNSPDQEHMLTYKEIAMNMEKHKVYIGGNLIELTYSEFKLLHLLINRKGKVYSRNQIIEKLNGLDYMATERSVDVQIVGLRKKIGSLRDYLETVRGVGYRMRD